MSEHWMDEVLNHDWNDIDFTQPQDGPDFRPTRLADVVDRLRSGQTDADLSEDQVHARVQEALLNEAHRVAEVRADAERLRTEGPATTDSRGRELDDQDAMGAVNEHNVALTMAEGDYTVSREHLLQVVADLESEDYDVDAGVLGVLAGMDEDGEVTKALGRRTELGNRLDEPSASVDPMRPGVLARSVDDLRYQAHLHDRNDPVRQAETATQVNRLLQSYARTTSADELTGRHEVMDLRDGGADREADNLEAQVKVTYDLRRGDLVRVVKPLVDQDYRVMPSTWTAISDLDGDGRMTRGLGDLDAHLDRSQRAEVGPAAASATGRVDFKRQVDPSRQASTPHVGPRREIDEQVRRAVDPAHEQVAPKAEAQVRRGLSDMRTSVRQWAASHGRGVDGKKLEQDEQDSQPTGYEGPEL